MGKWEMVRLGDLGSFQTGGTPSRSRADYFKGTHPWITTPALGATYIDASNANAVLTDEAINDSATKIIPAKSLMIGIRVGVGKVSINTVPMCTNQDIVSISNVDIAKVSLEYLHKYIATQQKYLDSQKRGATIQGIKTELLKELSIPLPPLPVQQQIADVLDRASALIEKRKAQIEKLDLLVKSQFIEMFGDPVTNPMGWEAKRLENIASVGSSKRVFVDELVESGIPFYRGTEIGAMATGEEITPSLFITKEHYDHLRDATGIPEIGDLLMPSICQDGRIWRVNTTTPFYFKDGRVLWVHFTEKTFDDTFLLYALKEKIIADYINIASGTTFAELKIFSLKSVSVMLPPLELQNQFAAFVQQVDAQKSLLQQSLAKLELNYKSLMQKCFRGEIF